MAGKIFENGAIVIEVWPDGSGELKATFQYDADADNFCKATRDKSDAMLVRVSLYDGAFRGFPANPNPEGE